MFDNFMEISLENELSQGEFFLGVGFMEVLDVIQEGIFLEVDRGSVNC